MSSPSSRPVGDWHFFPASGTLRRGAVDVRLTVQQQRLLDVLVEHAGDVVDKDTLFERVWDGAAVEDNALARCVSELRRLLGDDARAPRYIETLPRRGYRWIADSTAGSTPEAEPAPADRSASPRSPRQIAMAAGIVLLVALGGWYASRSPAARPIDVDEASSASIHAAREVADQGIAAARAGRFDDARAAFERAIVLFRRFGDESAAALQQVNLARVHLHHGEWSEAAAQFTAAEPILATRGDDRQYATLLVNLGTAHAAAGNLHLARHPLERSASLFGRFGETLDRAYALSLLGEVLIDSGALDEGRAALDEALTLRQASGDAPRIANSRITLAVAALELGDQDSALRLLEPVRTSEGAHNQQEVLAARLRARAHLAEGRLDDARRAIDDALSQLDSASDIAPTAFVRYWLPITHARVEAAEGSLDAASARLTALRADPEVRNLRLIDAEARLALAEIELRAGAVDSASARLAALLDEAEAAGWHLIASKAARVGATAIAAPPSD